MNTLCLISLVLAAIPTALFVANLIWFWPIRPRLGRSTAPVSVIIPARNEEAHIGEAVAAALASKGVDLELIVVDDHSTDRTPTIVRDIAAIDPRLRVVVPPELPPGWCGKQHACHVGAGAAQHGVLVFIDADLRVGPQAVATLLAYRDRTGVALVSGFPRQITGTLMERLVIPLIHYVLLGLLPLAPMRRTLRRAFAAGCGQLFLASRSAYEASGGHGAIRSTLMDGIALPRAFRRAGFRTDAVDATHLAECRMYQTGREVWNGLTKNAVEGMAAPRLIGPLTLLLFGGQVLPFLLLPWSLWREPTAAPTIALVCLIAYLPRLLGAIRFRQSWLGALGHPIGVAILLAIQWAGLYRHLRRRPAQWRGREYPRVSAEIRSKSEVSV